MHLRARGDAAVLFLVAFVGVAVVLILAILPNYRVYSKELNGKAMLREAEWSRKIEVEEAAAKNEAAALLAEAEITRARGVADANVIVADGLGGPEGYLRYLYIDALADSDAQLVYVPTETGLPILEANREIPSLIEVR